MKASPSERAVDRAIAAENARYLAQGPDKIKADAEYYRDATMWQLALRHGFGLGPQMDAYVQVLCAELRAETASLSA